MTKIFFLSLIISLSLTSYAQKEEMLKLFKEGNNLYLHGKFEKASSIYGSIIAKGYESEALFYNAGNASYRSNKIVNAIYFYEKAAKISPNDEALQQNLQMANLQIYDKIKPMPEFALKTFFKKLVKSQTADTWAYFSLISFLIVLAIIYLYMISLNKRSRLFLFITGTVLILFSTSAFWFSTQRNLEISTADAAIIFAPAVSVKSEPNDNSAELFVIHEGLKVEITDYSENWYEIKLPSGMTGWMKKSELKTL